MATRDYKKRSCPPKRNTTPGWVWLLAGLAVGLFVAFLVYLNRLPASRHSPHLTKDLSALAKSAVQDARSVKKEVTATAPDMQAKEKHKGINFDFYNILPEMEVPVPDTEPQGKGLPPAPVAPGAYVLQVGSFRSEKEADAQKANLALLGDKSFLFDPAGAAFIMYGVSGRSWVAMGDPVGDPAAFADLAWEFRELADRYGGLTTFYQAAPEQLPSGGLHPWRTRRASRSQGRRCGRGPEQPGGACGRR